MFDFTTSTFIDREQSNKYKDQPKIFNLYQSEKVQKENYAISVNPISRKNATLLKLELLSKLPEEKKQIVLFANHQLQYLFKGETYSDLFNIWMGNFGITEIADVIAYNYQFKKSALPTKILVTMITSPNNDLGDKIVGYRNELPDQFVGMAGIKSNKLKLSNLGSSFTNSKLMRTLKFKADYKYLIPFIKRPKVFIMKNKASFGDFDIDLNGSSTGYQGVPPYPLELNKKNREDLNGEAKLSKNDISEIVASLKAIDQIAFNLGIYHVLIIPPVYETNENYRMQSNVNLILDKALNIFTKNIKSSAIIDDRRNKKYLNLDAKKYYYHYDHPSPEYGKDIYIKLKEIQKKNL